MCVRSFAAIAGFLVLVGPSCSNSDNLALLLDTIKPVNRSICDDQPVSLACPTGTSISILVAQYGDNPPSDQECKAVADKSCKLPNKLQYMLLKRVVTECQKKPSCQFNTTFQAEEDPCSSSRKFVEVAYKCRPHDFRSLNACNDQVVHLNCNPHSRIAIYDVDFGRNPRDTVTCPQPPGVPDETCSTPYAVETVMRICHGKRRCQFVASRSIFDSLCKPYTKPYVKVIYACVPLGVLTDRYEVPAGPDETGISSGDVINESAYEGNVGQRWLEQVPAIVDSALQPLEETTTVTILGKKIVQYQPTSKDHFDNAKNKIYIYAGIVVAAVIIIVIISLAVLCYYTRKAKEIAENGEMFTAETPNVFNDAASDIDNDVEVSHISGTFYDPVHPDMILYRDIDGTRNTLRAMRPLSTIYPSAGPRMYGNVDYVPPQPRHFGKFPRSRSKEEPGPESMTSPKSLGAYSTSQFYYG